MAIIPRRKLEQIKEIVNKVVAEIKEKEGHYPEEITDLVFLKIEENYLEEYESWVNLPDGTSNSNAVNPYISRIIIGITGFKKIKYKLNPKSRLIKGYCTLG